MANYSTIDSWELHRRAEQHVVSDPPTTQSQVQVSIDNRGSNPNLASKNYLNQVLRSVSISKARQAGRQRARFMEGKSALLHLLEYETQGVKRLKAILNTYQDLPLMQQVNNSMDTFVANVQRFITQATRDPCVRLDEWECRLMSLLNAQSLRYEYSALYIEVMKEWMDNGDEPEVPDDVGMGAIVPEASTDSMEEHRRKWESYVFTEAKSDITAISAWLEVLFRSGRPAMKAIDTMRKEIIKFERNMAEEKEHFTKATMNWCVEGVLRSDLLTDGKRAVLTAMNQDKDTLNDMMDDLNMRMNTLDRWAWPAEGVPVEQRRQVGSKSRIFHDEDIMDALLLRYIGVKWSVRMSKSLSSLSRATWLSPTSLISKEQRLRRDRYLGPGKDHATGVNGQRLDTYLSDFLLTQLLKEEWEVDRGYDNGEEQDQQEGIKIRKSATELKHSLLQLLVTEVTMARHLEGEVMVLQSDFESFGPSIPHSTIAAVMGFFGVTRPWIQFFQKVLEVPVVFNEDGTKADIRSRRRGTSMSSPLADVFGETILFCMDYAVWHQTGGLRLYRLHDDFWLWGPGVAVRQGWQEMSRFATIMGLKFNTTKSGCVHVSQKSTGPTDKTLHPMPQGDVRYGFLKLLPTGYFAIDFPLVDKHIDALIAQLDSTRSLFAWIRTWNAHGVGYFTSMLGGKNPANCFGAQHVRDMEKLFLHVYQRVFQGQSNLTSHLRKQIKKCFPSFTSTALDAFIFLPIELGGLGAQNPFVILTQLHGQISDTPETAMTMFSQAETKAYNTGKASFERRHLKVLADNTVGPTEPFLSWSDYTRPREETSWELLRTYQTMLRRPKPHEIQVSEEVRSMLGGMEAMESFSPYTLWLFELYEKEFIENFGGLRIIDAKLLPMGMIKLARKQRIKWRV
ncbi:MAG: hypothetical protein LQ346_000758 [Caloplaca aetnensis]|nr:MAG: hypothetical protein LQ346_000758 [Caloplaca aetnensis]